MSDPYSTVKSIFSYWHISKFFIANLALSPWWLRFNSAGESWKAANNKHLIFFPTFETLISPKPRARILPSMTPATAPYLRRTTQKQSDETLIWSSKNKKTVNKFGKSLQSNSHYFKIFSSTTSISVLIDKLLSVEVSWRCNYLSFAQTTDLSW